MNMVQLGIFIYKYLYILSFWYDTIDFLDKENTIFEKR
jgi:hypothetical protein